MPGKPKADKTMKCQVQTKRACNGQGVRLMTGVQKGDPVFRCCLGCWAALRRMGVRMKEAKAGAGNT